MKAINKEELINNRFIKFTNVEKTRFKVLQPSKTLALTFHIRTLAILYGVNLLKTIDLVRAEKLANFCLQTKTKEEIINSLY